MFEPLKFYCNWNGSLILLFESFSVDVLVGSYFIVKVFSEYHKLMFWNGKYLKKIIQTFWEHEK